MVGLPRQDDVTSRFMSEHRLASDVHTPTHRYLVVTVPTVGDAIDAVTAVYEDLSQTLKHFSDVSAELDSQDLVLANLPEVSIQAPPNYLALRGYLR